MGLTALFLLRSAKIAFLVVLTLTLTPTGRLPKGEGTDSVAADLHTTTIVLSDNPLFNAQWLRDIRVLQTLSAIPGPTHAIRTRSNGHGTS